jgi:predicted secreted protein
MQSVLFGRRLGSVRWFFLLPVLAVAFTSQTAFAATKVVTDDDKGSDIQMKFGDLLEVHLKANPSAGYMWYVHPKSTALLKLDKQTQTNATEPGEDRPVIQVFIFEVKRKGDGILLMRYAQPKQRPSIGEEQFNLHLVIE